MYMYYYIGLRMGGREGLKLSYNRFFLFFHRLEIFNSTSLGNQ